MHPFGEFWTDDRAIEGLPIRLVIAIVIGVTSLSIMMSMLSGIGSLGTSELDVKPEEEVIEPEPTSMDVEVVDDDGRSVEGATVIVTSGSARLDEIEDATTGPNGSASIQIDPGLRPNQDHGTLEIDVKPPAGTDYADRRENTDILVVDR